MLSTMSGTLASFANLREIASMSMMTPPGLAMDSMKMAFVLSVTAAAKEEGSSASAHFTFQPKLLKLWLKSWLMEPP